MKTTDKITEREAAMLEAVILANKIITKGPEKYKYFRSDEKFKIEQGLILIKNTIPTGRSQTDRWQRENTIIQGKELLTTALKIIAECDSDIEEKIASDIY